MKENKEELIKIGQEQIDKAVELFEGKAIDALDFLTWQFKNDFASDIDYKLKGYKKDFEELNQKYCQLFRENEQLKSEQNKVAVEKLEELLKEYSVKYHLCDSAGGKYECSIYAVNDIFITEQIRELKGESDE